MKPPLHSASSMSTLIHLPEDPSPGTRVAVPKTKPVGGTTTISLFLHSKLIGVASQLRPVPNVSRAYIAERVMCNQTININTLIRIRGLFHVYTGLTFIQNLGWCGTETAEEPQVLSDKFYKVKACTLVGPHTDTCVLYEQLSLQSIEPKEKKK